MPFEDEHDRYQRFIAQLAAEAAPDEAFVDAYMGQVTSDADSAMGESAAIALINHPALTENLLKRIQTVAPAGWSAAAVQLDERQIRLRIEANPSDPALWDRAVRSGSRRLHLWVLGQPTVPAEVLVSLARHGATKAVRNRATHALRRKSGA